LHRDVKAANILLDTYGNARLCDAGALLVYLLVYEALSY
jgi:serine/threonine protein kinase